MNLMIAIAFSVTMHENPCIWYFINLMVDTTIGVFISYLFIRTVQHVAYKLEWDWLRTGNYVNTAGEAGDDDVDLAAWAT
jgi:hypothetical protein